MDYRRSCVAHRRRVTVLFSLMVLLNPLLLNALQLPEGTDAMVSEVRDVYPDGSIRTVILGEPTSLNTPIGHLRFSGWVSFHYHGVVSYGSFSEPQTIQTPAGVFRATSVSFHPDGQLMSVTFADGDTVVETPAGGIEAISVRFHSNGVISSVHASATAPTVVDSSIGRLPLQPRNLVSFHPSGELLGVWLNSTVVVRTEVGLLQLGPNSSVSFHENGRLRSAPLTRPQKLRTPLGERTFTEVSFADNGSFEGGWNQLPQSFPTPIGEVQAREITFRSDGNVRSVSLATKLSLLLPNGEISPWSRIGFFSNGAVEWVYSWETQPTMTPMGEMEVNGIVFNDRGAIRAIHTSTARFHAAPFMVAVDTSEARYDGYVFKDDDTIHGLIDPTWVNTRRVSEERIVRFSDDGPELVPMRVLHDYPFIYLSVPDNRK